MSDSRSRLRQHLARAPRAIASLAVLVISISAPVRAAELLWSTAWDNWTTIESVVWTDPAKNVEATDDFDVVGTIERLLIGGHNSCIGGCPVPPTIGGVWVRFYESAAGVPGALQYEVFLSATDPGFLYSPSDPATLDITLPTPFEATGRHFMSVQLVVDGAFYWSMWVANHNNAVGSHLLARDNLAGGDWEQQFDVLQNPLNDDLYFSLWGTPPGGGDPPASVAECGDWVTVDSPNPPTGIDSRLHAVEVIAPWDVWAVGSSLQPVPGVSGNDQFSLAMHWNGADWSIVPAPSPSPATGLAWVDLNAVAAADSNDVWAVGQKNDVGLGGFVGTHVMALHWNGSDWTEIELPGPDEASSPLQGASGDRLLDVAAIAPDDVWMVGSWFRFLPSDAVIWPGVAMHWNGSSVEIFEPPFITPTASQQLNAVSAVATNDVWAVGSGGGNESYIFHFDGSAWSHVPGPAPGTSHALAEVAALSANDVWAGGYYSDAEGTHPLMLHWDGSNWTQVSSPAGGSDFAVLATDDIFTVGTNGFAHWNGANWTAEPAPEVIPWGVVNDLEPVGPCELWGVGIQSVAGDFATLTVKLEPTGSPDDADADGVVDALDNCPTDFNPDQADCDGDGAGDVCELTSGTASDCNGNFTPDNCEVFVDCNVNDIPDECEADCNENGVADQCDITGGFSLDCDLNGTPDECDVFSDCNGNGVNDDCDIAGGGSVDSNANGFPDECEALGPETATVNTIDDVVDFGGAQRLGDLPGPDGRVSMREAVIAVNNTPGPQTIAFNVPPEGWSGQNALGPELRIEDGLFTLSDDGTTVDFTTQTAFTGDTNPAGGEVSMYGFEANAWGVTAIWIPANGCTIKGMGRVLQRGFAVEIAGNDNRVIGSTISGPIHAGVSITGGWQGPVAGNNVIGGTEPGEGNVISSIRIDAPAANNVVIGNVITNGIDIRGGATTNRIGGTTAAERNVISGAGAFSGEGCPTGEQISVEDSDGNVIEGNYIGTTPDGLASQGQIGPEGIEIRNSSNTVVRNNLIGGILVVGNNHCAGDRFGTAILVHGSSFGTVIQGNSIGTDVTGAGPITNLAGISVQFWPDGGAPGATLIDSNVIAFNEVAAVTVGPTVSGVTLGGNAIFDNGGAGIDLSVTGNGGQAAPLLDSANADVGGVRIAGTLAGNAGNAFDVEFFASPTCDPSGFGEGAVFLGSTTVLTNSGGNAGFDLVLPAAVPLGQVVTATATEQVTGNTSAFSGCVSVEPEQCSAAPGEVQGVFVDSTGINMSWTSMGQGVTYDVARGSVVGLRQAKPAECVSAGSLETHFGDVQIPVPGNAYYYLVRATNECGEGAWGTGSIGQLRATICP